MTLTGTRYGSRTIVSERITRVGSKTFVLTECDCGSRTQIRLTDLRSGRQHKCQACNRERAK